MVHGNAEFQYSIIKNKANLICLKRELLKLFEVLLARFGTVIRHKTHFLSLKIDHQLMQALQQYYEGVGTL